MSSHPAELIGCDPIRTGGIPSRLASMADAAAANVMAPMAPCGLCRSFHTFDRIT